MCVLSVVDPLIPATAFFSIPLATAKTAVFDVLLQTMADRLRSGGIETTTAVLEGYPPSRIVEYAERWGADFVFVGSHGHSAITRFLLGSVARAVIRDAPCSVEIVRSLRAPAGAANAGMRILLATDGSDYSVAAARSIAARPWPNASEAHVLSVNDLMGPVLEWGLEASVVTDATREGATKLAQEAVLVAEKILSDAGLKTSGTVLTGNPKTQIIDHAKDWGADLVVVGSHGRRGMRRILQGSVSEAVAMHAHSSVEVIRERTLL